MGRAAESSQEHGRDGLLDAKAWLETTAHIELFFNANRFRSACTLPLLNGKQKTFDLGGKLFVSGVQLWVESKAYETVGHQGADYDEFLVTAYSATVRNIDTVEDARYEFMWITTYPFAQGAWQKLTSRTYLRNALTEDKTGLLAGHTIREDVVDKVAERLWLIVVTERQLRELVLTDDEIGEVQKALHRRKGLN